MALAKGPSEFKVWMRMMVETGFHWVKKAVLLAKKKEEGDIMLVVSSQNKQA